MNRFRETGTYEVDNIPVSADIPAMKRNAIVLRVGATCILGIVGPAKRGEDMSAVVYALAIVGIGGMLVAAMSLLFRVISRLEQENMKLRRTIEDFAQKNPKG